MFLIGFLSSLEYNTNLIISKASYSYDQHKMQYSIYKIVVRITVYISIDCVCSKEPLLNLRFEEEEIIYNLVKVISQQAAFDNGQLRGAFKHLIINRRRFISNKAFVIRYCRYKEKTM